MKSIGTFQGRKVFWFDFLNSKIEELPTNDWISFTISDSNRNFEKFECFIKRAINSGLLEFKSQGKFGEDLHLSFDAIMAEMESSEQISFIDIPTTGDNESTLIECFWECFFATTLPDRTNFDELAIICMSLDGDDRSDELRGFLKQFEDGWQTEYF